VRFADASLNRKGVEAGRCREMIGGRTGAVAVRFATAAAELQDTGWQVGGVPHLNCPAGQKSTILMVREICNHTAVELL
jgi:hypothetical protein